MSILLEKVARAIHDHAMTVEELPCDPDFADTAAFCEKYGFTAEQSANTIIVTSKKVEPVQHAVCVVLATHRLDVNKKVTKLLGVKRASFADGKITQQLSGMEIGGVVAVGIDDLPIYVDKHVMQQEKVVMGGGNRTSKIVLNPKELLKVPNVQVVDIVAEATGEKTISFTRFGNPILRRVARELSVDEILSSEVQQLITDIRHTNQEKQYGVGLAAPQVGKSIALSVIGIKPTPNRPNLKPFESVIINPHYKGIGRRAGMWEGCQSSGSGDDTLFGKAMRYKRIEAEWRDENGVKHNEELDGFVAHVFQHECDHVHGVLFVDRIKDTKTFMLADEYRKRIIKK